MRSFNDLILTFDHFVFGSQCGGQLAQSLVLFVAKHNTGLSFMLSFNPVC